MSLLGKAASLWYRLTGRLRRPRYLTIHHSDSALSVTAVDIDRWHREKGWAGIAYHWVIERRPHVRTVAGRPDRDDHGRPAPVKGSAAWGLNHNSLAICVVGDFDREMVDDEVWRELVNTATIACRRHGIDPANIIGHCDVATLIRDRRAASSCPGKNMRALLPKLRQAVAEKR